MRKSIYVFFVCLLLTFTAVTALAKETPNDTQNVSETETTAVPETETTPTGADIPSYAESFFKNNYGNCYRFASAVAYIAVVLGFDARVETGALSRNGGKFASHGWTWIKIDKNWYIFDADVQTFYKRNCYMKSEKKLSF